MLCYTRLTDQYSIGFAVRTLTSSYLASAPHRARAFRFAFGAYFLYTCVAFVVRDENNISLGRRWVGYCGWFRPCSYVNVKYADV